MESDDNHVFLPLAASLTAEKNDDSFSTSDDEPLKNTVEFNESDLEPLKWQTGFDTSDEEPLQTKANHDIDDLITDPSYAPSNCEQVSTSKKGKANKIKKRKRYSDPDLQTAKESSLRAHLSHQRNLHDHTGRLDNILASNGLYRQEIVPDGNCFFEASVVHLEDISHLELRHCLCDHLIENITEYIHFMVNRSEEDENERYLRYHSNVSELRKQGRWVNDAADLLLRALADWAERTVVIYFSDVFKSQHEIHPSSGRNSQPVIPLAFIDFDPTHYDACLPLLRARADPAGPSTLHHSETTYTARPSKYADEGLTPNDAGNSSTRHNVGSSSPPNNAGSSSPPHDAVSSSPPHDAGSSSPPNNAGSSSPPHDAGSSSPPHVAGNGCTSNDADAASITVERCPSPEPDSSIPIASKVTPRKQGMYSSPPKKKLARQREARPETWKKNVRKTLHLQGKQYLSQSGKTVPAKAMMEVDCTKCRYKCSEKITEESRKELFDAFYALQSYERQKDFICANVSQRQTATMLDEDTQQPKEKKRRVCRVFSFNVNGTVHRVCKNYFLATLAVGETYVDHALENSTGGVFKGQQLRGKSRPPHNKYSGEAVDRAKQHIASFPVVESHYTRKDTQRLYLPSDLTLRKMYDLYTEDCQSSGHTPVSARKYRDIFNQYFNYSFHQPKKDQCVTCAVFQQKGSAASEEEKKEYEKHRDRKDRAREEKDRDKREAGKDTKRHVITVDLQAVLQAPCGLVSQLYYKRKLSVYNFTVYSLTDRKGTCFTWDESEGKRGSCRIATCLYIYLSSLPQHIEEVIIFSDCCSGQNRNQYLSAALIHAVNNISNIKVISHKYLETGHTHMECDSMHAAITFAKKHSPIYTPSGWDIILRMARRGQPYVVILLKHGDFLDFKHIASTAIRNTKTDLKGNKVSWLSIKVMQFLKGQEEIMFFKYSFDDQEFQVLKMIGPSKRRAQPLPTQIPRCYSSKLPVSTAKKQDLLSLCRSGIIPAEHHPFYESLSTSPATKDKLPEPDMMEDDCSDMD